MTNTNTSFPDPSTTSRALEPPLLPTETSSHAETAAPPVGGTYYVEVGGARKGPLTKAQVEVMVSTKQLTRDSLSWVQGDTDWKPLASTSFAVLFAAEPPPLNASAVPMGILWILAFAPLIGTLIEGTFVSAFNLAAGSLWWITVCLNVVLAVRDGRTLRAAGYDTSKMGAFWIVPVYLYKRAKALKQNQAPLIIWCVCWLGMILVVAE